MLLILSKLRMGERIHLCEYETDVLANDLSSLFDAVVDIPRVRYGKKQTLDTLISEEAMLLGVSQMGKTNLDSQNSESN